MATIDDIKAQTEAQKIRRDEARRKNQAKDAGFDDFGAFELWEALEELRKTTLSRRSAENPDGNHFQVNSVATMGRLTIS